VLVLNLLGGAEAEESNIKFSKHDLRHEICNKRMYDANRMMWMIKENIALVRNRTNGCTLLAHVSKTI
jgi:hypothetical protein